MRHLYPNWLFLSHGVSLPLEACNIAVTKVLEHFVALELPVLMDLDNVMYF